MRDVTQGLATAQQQVLHQALNRIAPLSQDACLRLAREMHPAAFVSGEFLLRGGEIARNLCLITEGLVREFHIDEQGVEHTRSFVAAGGVTGSLFDLLEQKPSVTWLQALEDTRVLVCPWLRFVELCDHDLELARLSRRATEQLYQRKARREYELLALNARQRLQRWLEDQPNLDGRVSRQLLASYLGVTPVHLSRLRRSPGHPRG